MVSVPEAEALPTTSSLTAGRVVPMPTLPVPLGIMAKCSLVPVTTSEVIPEKVTEPVEKVGALLKTMRPLPVSSEMERAALAEEIVVVN